jgi:vitamin B12 transporter
VRRPRHSGAASLNYRFYHGRGNVNIHLTHTGRQDDDTFLPPFFARQRVSLASFTLVGVSGALDLTDNVSLFARAENIFDDDYQEVFGFNSAGAAVYAGLRFQTSQ